MNSLKAAIKDFNPLPRKEGDVTTTIIMTSTYYFNPLPRKEGDENKIVCLVKGKMISIHSLVKRETICEHS